ncbi:MAG: hypothetical protein HY675_18120 [Chloroflexi bacterium]|nr:hypothetical protein [Chloroflexota bacterium]
MYGTLAKLRVKHGHIGGLQLVTEGFEMPKGAVAVYTFKMDADPDELWMVALFENKETYVANANSPEQHRRYQILMEYLETEPEWHDGEVVGAKTS